MTFPKGFVAMASHRTFWDSFSHPVGCYMFDSIRLPESQFVLEEATTAKTSKKRARGREESLRVWIHLAYRPFSCVAVY